MGVRAFTLFDSGSTSDAISPDFVPVANVRCFELTNPVILQLGTKGSRSTINHGSMVDFKFGSPGHKLAGRNYFDIANVRPLRLDSRDGLHAQARNFSPFRV